MSDKARKERTENQERTLTVTFDSPEELEAFRHASELQGYDPHDFAKATLQKLTKYLAETWRKQYNTEPPFIKKKRTA